MPRARYSINSTIPSKSTAAAKSVLYPVLRQVLEQACDVANGDDVGTAMPVARDLAAAWNRCAHTTSRAVGLGLLSHNSQVCELGAWLDRTDGGDLRKLGSMPDKAQRELSASVVSLVVRDFEERLAGATRTDASRRFLGNLLQYHAHA